MTLRRRGRVGGGRRPTVGERGAYNVQAAGSRAQLTGVCYPCSARRQVSFASVHQRRRRRARLDSPLQTQVFEDARNDAGLGNESNHLQLAFSELNEDMLFQKEATERWNGIEKTLVGLSSN